MLNDLAKEIVLITGFAKTPVLLTIYNLIGILVIRAFYDTIIYFNNKVIKDEKRLYVLNKKMQVVKIALYFIVTIIIWKTQIKSVMTLISLIGAAITIALKDIIANFFAGIYISIYKPFKVEDRIEIDGSTGDVVNINTLYFELLEVSSKEVGEQSTGIIVQIPNFMIFTKRVKNYTKAFKYIWNELEVKIKLKADLAKNKKELYSIVEKNDIVKTIPKKMQEELNHAIGNYRIYYNNLEPIIYTKVEDDCVKLTIRYLVHPKKARHIESQIWNKIYEQAGKKKLDLYTK